MNSKKLYRKTDPSSSKEAAENNMETFKSQKAYILAELKNHEGSTSSELAYKIDPSNYYYWRNICSRRLADLASDNKIKRSDIRLCNMSNRNAVTWYLNSEEVA